MALQTVGPIHLIQVILYHVTNFPSNFLPLDAFVYLFLEPEKKIFDAIILLHLAFTMIFHPVDLMLKIKL